MRRVLRTDRRILRVNTTVAVITATMHQTIAVMPAHGIESGRSARRTAPNRDAMGRAWAEVRDSYGHVWENEASRG